jgi:hypothetical protein
MVRVVLVGEKSDGTRIVPWSFLLCLSMFFRWSVVIFCLNWSLRLSLRKELVNINSVADVVAAFGTQWKLEGETGYFLEGRSIVAQVVSEFALEPTDFNNKNVQDEASFCSGALLLYFVRPASDLSDACLRGHFDTCLTNGTSVAAARRIVSKFTGQAVGHTRGDGYWQKASLLRDIAFLEDSRTARSEGRLFLLHDLCPLNECASDTRKLGHFTAAYMAEVGERRYHTLAVYMTLSSTGSVQGGMLENTVARFDRLREATEDTVPFNEGVFSALFSDRGASLDDKDKRLMRLF